VVLKDVAFSDPDQSVRYTAQKILVRSREEERRGALTRIHRLPMLEHLRIQGNGQETEVSRMNGTR